MKIKLDEGYLFGRGAFETIAVINKKPLFLEEHLNRLRNSLKFFEIEDKIKLDEIYKFIEKENRDNFALKIIHSDENFIINARDNNYLKNYKSLSLKISSVAKSSSSKILYHKSLSFYENIMEHHIANDEGFDSAIFINERGEITETAFANIFFIKDKKIYTPKISCGLLKGTMRDYLIKNYEIHEAVLLKKDLKNYDEAFISNSLMGIRNIEKINKIKFENKISKEILEDLKKFGF